VAIYRLLQEAAFDANDITIMTAAYEAALELLRLKDRSDPLTELIANKILEIYRNGEHDPSRVCEKTLTELGVTFDV
jgi:hypothetical protein